MGRYYYRGDDVEAQALQVEKHLAEIDRLLEVCGPEDPLRYAVLVSAKAACVSAMVQAVTLSRTKP